jgi:hypothetical protein
MYIIKKCSFAPEIKQMTMQETHQYQLIEGTFDPREAGKLLFTLIGDKISYHSKERFSIKEKYNGDVSHSEKRLEELKSISTALRTLIDNAITEKKLLHINSVVEIKCM